MRMKLEQIIEQMEVLNKTYDPVAPTAIGEACRALKQYKLLKEQYKNRLKSDMAAMLKDIQLEIEELDSRAGYDGNGMPTFSTDYIRKNKVNELIQQKIDETKAESEDT